MNNLQKFITATRWMRTRLFVLLALKSGHDDVAFPGHFTLSPFRKWHSFGLSLCVSILIRIIKHSPGHCRRPVLSYVHVGGVNNSERLLAVAGAAVVRPFVPTAQHSNIIVVVVVIVNAVERRRVPLSWTYNELASSQAQSGWPATVQSTSSFNRISRAFDFLLNPTTGMRYPK